MHDGDEQSASSTQTHQNNGGSMLDDVYITNRYYENYKGITHIYDNGIQEVRQDSQRDDKSYTSDITNIRNISIILVLCTLEEYTTRSSQFASEDN